MNEAVIVAGLRTAVGKAPRGALRTTRPDDMAAEVIRALLADGWLEQFADRVLALNGHPRPLHFTVTVAPSGALTERTRKRVPVRPMRPAMRTIGKGFSNRSWGPSLEI